jgi:hypothetical protein
MLIQIRRGLEANRVSITPESGELLFTTDTKKLYVGDGSTPGGVEVDMSGVPAPVQSVAGRTGDVLLVKSDVGLSSVDNTADANKPVSVAQQAALDAKATIAALTAHTSATNNPHNTTKAQVGLPDVDNVSAANLRDRSTHTGTQPTSSVAGLDAALAGKQPAGSYATTTQLTDGLDDKADVAHTHAQIDVVGLGAALNAKQDDLVSGTNIKTINGESVLGSGDIVVESLGETYEIVSKNLRSWGAVFDYIGDKLASITYSKGLDEIVKTFNYTGDELTSITLSGDVPAGIDLTKEFSSLSGQLIGVGYS